MIKAQPRKSDPINVSLVSSLPKGVRTFQVFKTGHWCRQHWQRRQCWQHWQLDNIDNVEDSGYNVGKIENVENIVDDVDDVDKIDDDDDVHKIEDNKFNVVGTKVDWLVNAINSP